MSKTLRAGLVGCGSVSQRGILPHLSHPDTRDNLRLVAVADAVEERARETASHFDAGTAYGSVEAMLQGTDLDIVLVATPIPYHFANAMAAIAAGKHVYVQKTMTTTLRDANELLAARDKAGIKLAAAPGFDLFPVTGQMRDTVASGTLGHIYSAYTYTLGFGHEHEPIREGTGVLAEIDPSWYYRPGGGPLPDVTVYALQLITCVLGPVRRVTALANKGSQERVWRGKIIPVDVEDNVMVLMEFASGTIGMAAGANSRGSARIPWGGMGLYGTEASLEVTEVNWASGYPLSFEVQGKETREQGSQLSASPYITGEHLSLEEPHLYADIMDLVQAIRDDRPPRATGEQARHVVEIVEMALQAAHSGQTQELTTTFSPA